MKFIANILTDKQFINKELYNVVNDKDKASRSLRISLSYLTTKEELDKFISVFSKLVDELHIK